MKDTLMESYLSVYELQQRHDKRCREAQERIEFLTRKSNAIAKLDGIDDADRRLITAAILEGSK